jgi:hypothetical protein
MSTELKMRSLRFLNNVVLKINQTKPKSKETDFFFKNVNQISLIVTSKQK